MERIYILFLNEQTLADLYDNDGNIRAMFTPEWLEEDSDTLTLMSYTLPLDMNQVVSVMEMTQRHQEYVILDEGEYEYLNEFV